MKSYLEETIANAEEYAGKKTKEAIAEAKEVLSDERFIIQKGLRSLSDKDARVGNKSKTQQFYGYKAEYTMTADERIITAIDVHTGEYVYGKEFSILLEKTVNTGTKVSELYGDKAYFRKDILELLEEQKIKGYIPVSARVYKIDEGLPSVRTNRFWKAKFPANCAANLGIRQYTGVLRLCLRKNFFLFTECPEPEAGDCEAYSSKPN